MKRWVQLAKQIFIYGFVWLNTAKCCFRQGLYKPTSGKAAGDVAHRSVFLLWVPQSTSPAHLEGAVTQSRPQASWVSQSLLVQPKAKFSFRERKHTGRLTGVCLAVWASAPDNSSFEKLLLCSWEETCHPWMRAHTCRWQQSGHRRLPQEHTQTTSVSPPQYERSTKPPMAWERLKTSTSSQPSPPHKHSSWMAPHTTPPQRPPIPQSAALCLQHCLPCAFPRKVKKQALCSKQREKLFWHPCSVIFVPWRHCMKWESTDREKQLHLEEKQIDRPFLATSQHTSTAQTTCCLDSHWVS